MCLVIIVVPVIVVRMLRVGIAIVRIWNMGSWPIVGACFCAYMLKACHMAGPRSISGMPVFKGFALR